jgi:membrane protein required for colicin V production
MLVDIITFCLLIWAVIKGISKGLLLAVFSLVAIVIGLAAALKLSAVTANWLHDATNIGTRWLPLLAFLLVFIAVVVIVNKIGRLLEKTVEWAFLGWLNKAGGIVFFAILYLLIWSILLFYAGKMQVLTQQQMNQSVTYSVIAPWGPKLMAWIAQLVPVFKDVFQDMEAFFERLSTHIKPPAPTA